MTFVISNADYNDRADAIEQLIDEAASEVSDAIDSLNTALRELEDCGMAVGAMFNAIVDARHALRNIVIPDIRAR